MFRENRLAYRIGNFFQNREILSEPPEAFPYAGQCVDLDLYQSYQLTNHVHFRIDADVDLYAHVELRGINIELYSDMHNHKKIRVTLFSASFNHEQFFKWFANQLKPYHLKEAHDYFYQTLNGRSSHHASIELQTSLACIAIMKVLKGKLPANIFRDFENILNHFIEDRPNASLNELKHATPERAFQQLDETTNEPLLKLLELCYNHVIDDCIHPQRILDPLQTSRGLIAQIQGYSYSTLTSRKKIATYSLIIKKELINKSGCIEYKYLLALENSKYKYTIPDPDSIHIIKESDLARIVDDMGRPLLKIDQAGNWIILDKKFHKSNWLRHYIQAAPAQEFDELLARTAITSNVFSGPKMSANSGLTLTHAALVNPNTSFLKSLLAYGLDFSYSCSPTNPVTPYEMLMDHLMEKNSDLTEHLTAAKAKYAIIQSVATSLKKSIPEPSIKIKIRPNEIYTHFIFAHQEINTLIKLSIHLTSEEKKQLSDINELCFHALITKQEKNWFLLTLKGLLSITNTTEIKDYLWIKMVEHRFKIQMTIEEKNEFLSLFSSEEKHEFYQRMENIYHAKAEHEFWHFLNKSLVRYSFYQDVTGPHKLVELVYKNGEMIAGSIRALYSSKLNPSRMIWHGVLTAKRPSSSNSEPRGFMQFLAIRGPLSLGLPLNSDKIPYEILMIVILLNPGSHRFFEKLGDYYPKFRSSSLDEIVEEAINIIYQGKTQLVKEGISVYLRENIQSSQVPQKNGGSVYDELFNKLIGNKKLSQATDPSEQEENFNAVPAGFLIRPNNDMADKLNQLQSNNQFRQHLLFFKLALDPLINQITKKDKALAKL